jgi:hypothetical protein
MATDRALLATQQAALFTVQNNPGPPVAPVDAVNRLNQRHHRVYITDGGTAGTAQTETAFASLESSPAQWKVISATLMVPVAITANGSNLASIFLNKRTITAGAAGAAVVVASLTTNTTDPVLGTNAAAFVGYAMTLSATAANLLLSATATTFDVMTANVTKTGTGVAIAAATSQAYIDVLVQEQ